MGGLILGVMPFLAVKDQVGGEKDKRNGMGQLGQVACRIHIDRLSFLGLGFALRAFAHGGTVDDSSRCTILELPFDSPKIQQIKVTAQPTNDLPVPGALLHHMVANEATSPGHPDGAFPQSLLFWQGGGCQ